MPHRTEFTQEQMEAAAARAREAWSFDWFRGEAAVGAYQVLADIAAAAGLACSYEARDCLRLLYGGDSLVAEALGWDNFWSNGMSMYSNLAADEICTADDHGRYAAWLYEQRQQQLDAARDPHDVALRVNDGAHCGDPTCGTCPPITDDIIRTAFTPEEQQAIVAYYAAHQRGSYDTYNTLRVLAWRAHMPDTTAAYDALVGRYSSAENVARRFNWPPNWGSSPYDSARSRLLEYHRQYIHAIVRERVALASEYDEAWLENACDDTDFPCWEYSCVRCHPCGECGDHACPWCWPDGVEDCEDAWCQACYPDGHPDWCECEDCTPEGCDEYGEDCDCPSCRPSDASYDDLDDDEGDIPALPLMPEPPPGRCRIGVELEFDQGPSFTSRADIMRQLNESGLPCLDIGYSHEAVRFWKMTTDSTVSGGELVTPILDGSDASIEQVREAIRILKANGAVTSRRVGLHVHVDVSTFRRSQLKAFLVNAQRVQDMMCAFVPSYRYEASGWAPKITAYEWSQLATWLNGIPEAGVAEHISGRRGYQSAPASRGAFNFNSLLSYGTVECRLLGHTLNTIKVRAWIRVLQSLVEASRLRRACPSGDILVWLSEFGLEQAHADKFREVIAQRHGEDRVLELTTRP